MGFDAGAGRLTTARMRSSLLVVLSVIAAVLCGRATGLRAECLILPPPCEAMNRESVVVVAKVLEKKAPWDQPRRPGEQFMREDVRLSVLERFKGLTDDQRDISISIPWTTESIGLAQDRIYLIYAFVNAAGDWQTACTRTRPVTEGDSELRLLRQCR